MRIKKLELVGFKSFKDRTVLHFDAGITGVVGPNGCGKSNIVDALLWVMGEMSAKDLRGSTMTDVIFAGSEGYAPLGMCEVSLTLENDGGPFPVKYLKHSEIMVTRRLHRSAEGEYFINKEPARLKDIQEIFMDTGAGAKGFSIIQQGMIGRIITAKPEDRKHLIEEAAGITKFKARKKESQRKLQSTEQNLLRLQDIIGELKRQIDSLQRQAQRAERYRQLKNQIEDLDLWLTSLQFVELKKSADEAQGIFNEAQSAEAEGEVTLASLQTELEALKLSLLEKEKTTEELQGQYYAQQSLVQKKELEIQELKFEIETARRNEQMTGTLLQEQQARLELLQRDQAQYQAQMDALKSEAESSEKLFIEKNEIFQNAQSRIDQIDDELTTSRQELFAVGQSESSLDAKTLSLSTHLQDLRDRENNEQLVLNELREKHLEFENRRRKVFNELEKERQMQLDLANDFESFEANKRILTESAQEKRRQVEEFKDNLNEVASRLYGLENLHSNFEGFEEGVKNVMLWQKSKTTEVRADGSVETYFQPVSEVVEVPSEYEVAMEAALGSRLQMLLASDSNVTLDAVQYLKESKSGRSSFMDHSSKSWYERSASPETESGVQALLSQVVRSHEKYQPAVGHLLDGVAIVDSVRTALGLRARYPGWTFVTQDGDTLTADGVLTGGTTEGVESGVLKRRREIKELSQKKDEWGGKLALAQVALKKTEEQLANVMNDFEGAQRRKVEQEIKVTELKKDIERAEHELSNAQYAVERQEREVRKLTEQIQAQDQKFQELNQALNDIRVRKADLEAKSETLNDELVSTKLGFEGLSNEVKDLEIKTATKSQEYQGVLRQLEMINKSVADLEAQLSRMSEESEQNRGKMTEGQLKLEEEKIYFEKLVHEVEERRLGVAKARDEYEQMAALARELDEKASVAQRARNERQARMNEAQLKLEQARMKEQYLTEQVRERYMLILSEILPKYEGREGDPVAAETELKELREKLGKIGEVNLSAIEEYEETSQRYEFLTKQHNDLNEAKEQLKRVIDRINRICSKRVKET